MNILEYICAELADEAARTPKSEEYRMLMHNFSENIDTLEPMLSNPQREMLLELESQRNLIAAMDEEVKFRSGFRMGANLMLELLRPEQINY